ncbi:MAG: HEAT repeat domain-containing protein [Planctomycetota bacterium]
MHRPSAFPFLLAGLVLLWGGCRQTEQREFEPLSEQERQAQREPLTEPGDYSRIEDRATLFLTLDRNLKTWNDSIASKTAENRKLTENLHAIITRSVYWNFDVVLDELKNGTDDYTRIIAAGALGFSKTLPTPERPDRSAEAIEVLLSVLDRGNDAITNNAVLSLGQIGSPTTPKEPIVELMLRHHDPEVRANATRAFGRLATPDDAEAWLHSVIAALDDPEPKVRLHATAALGKLKHPDAASSLVRKLSDDRPLVRAGALRALGELGDARYAVHILPQLTSPVALVRDQAHRSLCQLAGKDLGLTRQDWETWCLDHAQGPSLPQ